MSEEGRPPSLTLLVHPGQRRGLTLLEVLLALTIFLFSMVAIGRLITLGGDRARDIQGREAQLCQSKLAEVVWGILPLSAGSTQEGTFEEDPDWHWTVECQDSGIPSLWNVKVTVSRKRGDGSQAEAILTQMVLDPSQRGSTLDPDPIAAANNTTDDSSGSSSSGDSSSSPTASPMNTPTAKPQATTPAVAPAPKPAPAPAPAVNPSGPPTPAKSSPPAKGGKS